MTEDGSIHNHGFKLVGRPDLFHMCNGFAVHAGDGVAALQYILRMKVRYGGREVRRPVLFIFDKRTCVLSQDEDGLPDLLLSGMTKRESGRLQTVHERCLVALLPQEVEV